MRIWHVFQTVKLTPSRILVIGFAILIFLGAFILSLPIASQDGKGLRFLDALFTATSGVCVTGLIVVDTGTHFSKLGQFVLLALIQIGGLGFMTLSTLLAMLLGKKIGLKERILIQESFNQFNLAGLVKLIRHVVMVTAMFELVGGIILSLRFMKDFPFGRAVAFGFFHSVSSFCNAGFDLFGQVFGPFSSITHYVSDWIVSGVVAALIVAGGLGFPVIAELLKYRRTGKLSLHTKVVLRITTLLIVAGMVLVLAMEFSNETTMGRLSPGGKLLSAFFQSVTCRTAGYNTLDMALLRDGTWFLMIILMFIGASPSSTGGGIKTTTFGLMMATVYATVKGKSEIDLFERKIPQDLVYRAITITTIALGWVVGVTLIMVLIEPFDFIRLFFEVMSAFGTVGLTTGITSKLTDLSRLLLIITMFIGRVGVLTVALALANFHQPSSIKYIEERIVIG